MSHSGNAKYSILFVRHACTYNVSTHTFKRKKSGESSHRILFILSKICEKDFYEYMPKTAKITTKNTTLHFNLPMLKETSAVISRFYQDNPNANEYHINITDDENTLTKFEQLYQGKDVFFEEEEIPLVQRFTQILRIFNCPNFLKQSSLKINEIDSEGYFLSDSSSSLHRIFFTGGVEIYKKYFVNFLTKDDHQTFKIITNKKEYKCCIFSIYTSNVIRQILDKDPTINEYVYNFEDKNNEFQLICDFFNCKKIDIQSIDIDSLKSMAEDLQINCILQTIDNYYNHLKQNAKKINDHKEIIDSINELFDLLCNIKKYGIEKVKNSIVQSKWSQNEENVEELAAFILQVIKPSFSLQKEIAELIIQLNEEANDQNKLNILIPFIVDRLMTLYFNHKSYQKQSEKDKNQDQEFISLKNNINLTNKCVYSFIRILHKRGLIAKEEIYKRLKIIGVQNSCINAFFLPELVKINPKNYDLIADLSRLKIRKKLDPYQIQLFGTKRYGPYYFLPKVLSKYPVDKIDLYEQMLDNLETNDELTKSLIDDDADKLQKIISKDGIDINKKTVPYNIFDDIEEELSLIDYAAFKGSINCFQYLLSNKFQIKQQTFYYAIYGNNKEIIKIVDQQNLKEKEKNQEEEEEKMMTPYPENSLYYENLNQTQNIISLWFDFKKKDKINNHYNPYYSSNELHDKYNDDNIQIELIFSEDNDSHFFLNYCNINNLIAPTIAMHQNELFDWVFKNQFINNAKYGNDLNHIAFLSASSGNVYSLMTMIENGFHISKSIISYTAKNGFYSLSKLLLDLYDAKNNNPLDLSDSFDPKSIVKFGNLSIFKLFIDKINQFDLMKAFIQSIKLNYVTLFKYVLDNIDKFNFILYNDKLIFKALKFSIYTQKVESFNFLMEQFKKLRPDLFVIEFFVDLLEKACLYSNLEVTKIITEIILNNDSKFNFTREFNFACSSKTTEICQYFLDKKVQIDLVHNPNIQILGNLEFELFEKIVKMVDSNYKFMFYNCIYNAIRAKNLKVIEFLLKEYTPNDGELYEAVSTNDLEVVEMILKYNKEPSFINKIFKGGTVLHNAVYYNNIQIFKLLLSLPGIDLTLLNINNQTALCMAVKNYCYEIVDAIFDYYEENLDKQELIFGSFNAINNLIIRLNYYNIIPDDFWLIFKRIIGIKSIDINLIDSNSQHPLLNTASFFNKIDFVESLLKIESINVNSFDYDTNNTPLLIALERNNLEIVKLLINCPKTDINILNTFDESALIIAIKNDQKEIIDLLLNDQRFDPIKSRLNYGFIFANNEISKQLYSINCLDVNQSFFIKNVNGNTKVDINKVKTNALQHSIKYNNVDKIDMIIKHPSFNILKSNVHECIFIAAKNNNINAFKKLMKLINNDINIHNKNGVSLIKYAAFHLSGEIIDEILNNELFDPKNEQLLYAFSDSYSQAKEKITYYHKSDNNTVDVSFDDISYNRSNRYDSRFTIHAISEKVYEIENKKSIPKKLSIIELMNKLLNYDINHEHLINFNKLLPNGKSFFTSIVNNFPGIEKISDFLIDHGVDPNMPDKNGVYPLEHAIKINSLRLATSLLNSNKIDFNAFNYLHLAVKNKDTSILALLLKTNKIDVNSVNEEGETPLMEACKSKCINSINLLFKNENLDYLHCDKNGKDALDLLGSLSPNDKNAAKQSKELYHFKLIHFINTI